MPKLQTDLNERERARYAKALRNIAEGANTAADALEAKQDDRFIVPLLLIALTSQPLFKELLEVIQPDTSKEEFPSTIGE